MRFAMKMRNRLALASPCWALRAPAWVHHSGAMFDRAKEQTIAGTITEFNWIESALLVQGRRDQGADGKEVVWAIEMNSPQNLVREGWKRTTIKTGDKVTRRRASAARRQAGRLLRVDHAGRRHQAGRQRAPARATPTRAACRAAVARPQ